jgi:hypothetical protein
MGCAHRPWYGWRLARGPSHRRDLRAGPVRRGGVRVRPMMVALVLSAACAPPGCGETGAPPGEAGGAPAGAAARPAPTPERPATASRLPSRSFPYLGIACHIANWARCDRIRIGVHLARPAVRVTVQVDGRLVNLTPPPDPGDDLWEGALLGAGPRHGPLRVRARHGYWYGEPPVYARVRVTAYYADGTTATHADVGYLHAGYG